MRFYRLGNKLLICFVTGLLLLKIQGDDILSDKSSDHDLLKRFYRHNDDTAINQFLQRHREWAIRQASLICSEEAEDIVQIATMRLLNAQPNNGCVHNPLGWWKTLIVHVAFDVMRSKLKRSQREIEFTERSRLDVELTDKKDAVAQKQSIACLRHIVDGMDDKFRSVLSLRFFNDCTYAEISEILNIRIGTVASRVSRGLERLKTVINADETELVASKKSTPTRRGLIEMVEFNRREHNRKFASRWDGQWTVAGRSLGRFTAKLNPNDDVIVTYREDTPVRNSNYERERPDRAANRWWNETVVTFTNTQALTWTNLRLRKGAYGSARQELCSNPRLASECEVEHSSPNELWVENQGSERVNVRSEGNGPVLTNNLLPVFIRDIESAKLMKAIRLFGIYEPGDSKQPIDYAVVPCQVHYTDWTSQPSAHGHLFDLFVDGKPWMQLSLLEEQSQDRICINWPEESIFLLGEEDVARGMLKSA